MPLTNKKRKAQAGESASKRYKKNIAGNLTQMRLSDMMESNSQRNAQTVNDRSNQDIFSIKQCLKWFKEYSTGDQIEPEGMEKLCINLSVEPDDIVMLVLAYRLNAKKMGFFSKEEWIKGMQSLQCDSNHKILNKLQTLRKSLDDLPMFKSIYRYAFDFVKDPGLRTIDFETAKVMLSLLFDNRWPLFSTFYQFMDSYTKKVMNRDQWNNVLEFSRSIRLDLSNYDMDGAWPVMLDEFVEFAKSQRAT